MLWQQAIWVSQQKVFRMGLIKVRPNHLFQDKMQLKSLNKDVEVEIFKNFFQSFYNTICSVTILLTRLIIRYCSVWSDVVLFLLNIN